MSILIKGMEMPKDCFNCRFHKSLYCTLTDICTNTAQGCPLVALPDKHGRLIDADELKANIHMEGYRGYRARDDGAVTTFNYINDAPTIIEAEE